ncbi:MAG: leucine-rich repeat protein [Prevotella sp.]|nr:leucine-rich repeat protein [Prevotella sp.]
MKRFVRLSIMLTVVLSMSGLNASAYDIAVKDANSVTIYYNYYNEGTELEVTNDDISQMPYTGNVVIPEEVMYDNQTLKVTSIGDRAFYNCFGLTSITIPKSMRAIGEDAFKGCGNISSVHISDLAAWCNIAFFNNSSNPMCWDLYNDKHLYLNGSEVKDLVIPSGVTSIGQWAFANCKSITSVTIPNSVTYIGTAAFNSCPNIAAVYISDLASWCGITFVTGDSNPLLSAHRLFLNGNEVKDLVIPSTVTSIGADAFQDCTGLTSVTIPNSVTTIGGYAFYGCTGINSLNIPNSVTTIGDYAFYGCTEINSLNIPNSLTTIENGTFRNCSNITSVSIPASLTSVGDDAFKGCSRLTSVHISDIAAWCNISFSNESANPLLFAHHLFLDGSEVKDLVIPSRVTAISNYAFNGCTELTSIDIGNRVKTIGWCAFQDCQRLTSLNIGNNVTSIGNAAFNGCTSLTKLTIPNSVTSIDSWAFANCTSLENFIIPNSVKNIEGGAFKGCSSLTSVIIPNSVTYLGVITFYECKRLTSVIIGNGVTSIENSMFAGCSSLSSVTLGNNVTSIESNAFRDCTSLPSMNIPEGVTSIGEAAFYDCKGLTSVTIPNSLTSIGWGAFSGCSSLESVTIPNSVTELGAYAFQGCNHLTSAIIGDGVTSIGGFAFYECGRLSTVIIGNSIKEISRGAFSNCTSLKDFYCYSKDVPTANGVFTQKYIQNVTLYVPITAVNAYQAVEPWKNFKEIIGITVTDDYRPFVEESKVWQVGASNSGNPVQWVEYFYFDGDTIIDGKTCKQMMCQRYVSPDYPDYDYISQQPSLTYVGAWYEEDKKVYEYDSTNKQFKMMYDFSVEANDTLWIDNLPYVIGPRKSEGINGFKGVYRDVMMCKEGGGTFWSTPWLEGVGGICGMTTNVIDGELADPEWFLMSCTVGDEVIYLNDEYEDGATPESMNAKKRFDFTHTIKVDPKAPKRRGAGQPLYGEYNNCSVVVYLYLLDDAYQVRITDATGKIVYENNINAGNIVGLNIDISTYPEGCYTVTMENNHESFTGEFEIQTTGIAEVRSKQEAIRGNIYNLQGQRLNSLQKGLNIVNGRKVYVGADLRIHP